MKIDFVATLTDNKRQTASQIDAGHFRVYGLKPGDRDFKREQLIRVHCPLRGKTVFRYIVPWSNLDRDKLLIDWQTAVALGLGDDYEAIEAGSISLDVEPARPFIDQALFVLHEKHPDVKLAMASGMVGGMFTGVVFFLLDKLI